MPSSSSTDLDPATPEQIAKIREYSQGKFNPRNLTQCEARDIIWRHRCAEEGRQMHDAPYTPYITPSDAPDSWMYVIQAGGSDGPVKLGIAFDPEARLAELQTGNHVDLKLLAAVSGGRELEASMHKELKAHRLRGEWFRPTAEVRDALRRVFMEPGRVSYRNAGQRTRSGCHNCGAPDRWRQSKLCQACLEFRELRASGVDPFAEAA